MCNSPVVVQFGLQFFLIAVHFNSFGVKMNSIDEISFLEGLITLIPINISHGCKELIKNNLCQSHWVVIITVWAELPRSGDVKSADFSFCASCHFCTCLTWLINLRWHLQSPLPHGTNPTLLMMRNFVLVESSTNQTQLLLWLLFRRKCNPYFETIQVQSRKLR